MSGVIPQADQKPKHICFSKNKQAKCEPRILFCKATSATRDVSPQTRSIPFRITCIMFAKWNIIES